MIALDLDPIAKAMAAAARTIPGLNASPHMPNSVTEPEFVVVGIDRDFNRADGRPAYCMDELTVICGVLLGRTDVPVRTAELYQYASPGSLSVRDALELDPTLGGLVNDLTVVSARIPRIFDVGTYTYFAAEFRIRIDGSGV